MSFSSWQNGIETSANNNMMKKSFFVIKVARFIARLVSYTLTITTVLLILLAITGQIVRDRTVEWALLMYIPLVPLGLWAIILDLVQIGRSLPRLRFGLSFMGLAILTWGTVSMMGFGGAEIQTEAKTQISVLHWNVYWGGRRNSWQLIRHEIEQRKPDIAILNETPSKNRLTQLFNTLGGTTIMYEETRSNPLAVYSVWPLTFERYLKIKEADAMTVLVTVQGHPLRVLAIDSGRNMSNKLVIRSKAVLPRWRMPMLMDIVKTIETHHAIGQPIDIIAGDFNAISRSLGFDRFAEAGGGYFLASKFAWGWRGTWKSYLPLFDLDHVWIHKRFQILRTELFTHQGSDHRGQLVRFQLL
jgi:endonuclease/exonuclease/phosphatase (EEP) superfamily protein YafD